MGSRIVGGIGGMCCRGGEGAMGATLRMGRKDEDRVWGVKGRVEEGEDGIFIMEKG